MDSGPLGPVGHSHISWMSAIAKAAARPKVKVVPPRFLKLKEYQCKGKVVPPPPRDKGKVKVVPPRDIMSRIRPIIYRRPHLPKALPNRKMHCLCSDIEMNQMLQKQLEIKKRVEEEQTVQQKHLEILKRLEIHNHKLKDELEVQKELELRKQQLEEELEIEKHYPVESESVEEEREIQEQIQKQLEIKKEPQNDDGR